MTGTHVVEECPEIDQWRPRKAVWKDWREALGGRAAINKRKKKEEEEGDLLGAYFFRIYEFLYTFSNPPLANVPFVPAELPARYAIAFVSANVPVPASVPVSVPSSDDFSVVSSANFIPAFVFTSSSSCIGTTQ